MQRTTQGRKVAHAKTCVRSSCRGTCIPIILSKKFCTGCDRTLPISAFSAKPEMRNGHHSRCRECVNAKQRRNYDKERQRAYYARYKHRALPMAKARALERRREVIAYYSDQTMACVCCGIRGLPFLTIDHIDGKGAEQRRKLFGGRNASSVVMNLWLVQNNFPPGFQVLCYNCNCAKGTKKGCPHQTQPDLYPKPQYS